MENTTFTTFESWAEEHGWFEYATSEPDEDSDLINHYYFTPAGASIQIIEGEGEVISLIYPNIRESR